MKEEEDEVLWDKSLVGRQLLKLARVFSVFGRSLFDIKLGLLRDFEKLQSAKKLR
jgi:hypothetical protein